MRIDVPAGTRLAFSTESVHGPVVRHHPKAALDTILAASQRRVEPSANIAVTIEDMAPAKSIRKPSTAKMPVRLSATPEEMAAASAQTEPYRF